MSLFSSKVKNDVLSGSTRATCGAFEREKIVLSTEVAETIKKLRAKGFIIVGTSLPGKRTRTIWFNPAGVNL